MTTYPPPPGQPAAPPPKRGWVKWVVLGCFGILLLAGLVGGGLYWGMMKATAGPEKAVKSFLAAAAARDYRAAHEHFSGTLKQQQSYEDFVREADSPPSYADITATSFSNRSVDQNGAELRGTVTMKSGEKVPAAFRLVKQNGEWKISAYQLGGGS